MLRFVRDGTGYLVLMVAALALLALLPLYPTTTTDYAGWFGPPGRNFRYVNGTTVHPAIEVLGGSFDWTTTSGSCVTDAGGWIHFVANPFLLLAFALAALAFWLLLLAALSWAGSEATKALILTVISLMLVVGASIWLVWYGLLFVACPTDFGVPRAVAAALAVLCLAVGLGVAILRGRLAALAWRPPALLGPRIRRIP
jgi:hypothetical protein